APRYLPSFPTRRSSDLDLRGFADDHAHSVVDEDAAADRSAGVDFDAGEPASPVGQPARKPAEPGTPQGMHHPAMPGQGMQPRVRSEEHTSELQSRGHLV